MSTATYTVTGMTCSHCVSSVTEEVTRIPGVIGIDVDLSTGALELTSDRPLDRTSVKDAVADAGYELASA